MGAAFTAVAGMAFLVGTRVFPERDHDGSAGGDTRRRAEIRAYLDAIGEQYAEDHPVAGQSVAFYLPERDVAVTFDARAFFRIDGTDTRPVLVEHELPGAALGRRLPFETPDPAPEERPEPDRDAPLAAVAFDELGVSPDAAPNAVTAAYRRRVKEVHPDQGGDPEAFRRVREAYTVAMEAAGSTTAEATDPG
ncbi:MAG: J domain-containing protein [Halobacteriales archaeon]